MAVMAAILDFGSTRFYLLHTSHLEASYQVSSQLAFWFTRRSIKIDFQDDGHLGFLIRNILAFFDLQVIPMLPTKFQVDWPFGSGEEAKNTFSRWWSWWPSWILFRKIWTIFYLESSNAFYQASSQLAFLLRRRSEKFIFKKAAILDFQSERFLLFLIYKSS